MASPTLWWRTVSSSDCVDGGGNGTAVVLLGNGDGTFQTAVTYGSGGQYAVFGGGGGCERGRQARPAGGELVCQQQL